MSKIWYACYGSNILYERFCYYIKGGIYALTGKTYPGCSDKTLPTEDAPIVIPYEMYFGNKSHSWGDSGVAFLDTSKPSAVLGRAYLISDEQFNEIQLQEGTSSNWYNYKVDLGYYRDYPIKTFTNSTRRPENRPSDVYLQVIMQGMQELIGTQMITPNK